MDLGAALERWRATLVAVVLLVLLFGDSGRTQARALHKRQIFRSCCFIDLFCFAMCVESSADFARHQRSSKLKRSLAAGPQHHALSPRFQDLHALLERAVTSSELAEGKMAKGKMAEGKMADCDARQDRDFTRLLRQLQLVAGPAPLGPGSRQHPVRKLRVKRLRSILRRLLRDLVRKRRLQSREQQDALG